MTSKMAISAPFSLKIAHLSYFDSISETLDTNIITYPIRNLSANSVAPFQNSQNDVIWRNDVITTPKMATFGPFSPKIAHLSYFDPITALIVYTIPYKIRLGIQWRNVQILKMMSSGEMTSKSLFYAHFQPKSHIWALWAPLLALFVRILYPIS